MNDTVKELRNPLYFPAQSIKRAVLTMAGRDLTAEDDIVLSLELSGYLHPSLKVSNLKT